MNKPQAAKSAYEQKPGKGAAFPNDKKVEDWHADYKGRVCLPDGSMHWLDVTIKTAASGMQYAAVTIGNACDGSAVPEHGPKRHLDGHQSGFQKAGDATLPSRMQNAPKARASVITEDPDSDIPW
jgi:hypothetical protein